MDEKVIKWLALAASIIAISISAVKISENYFASVERMQKESRQVIEK